MSLQVLDAAAMDAVAGGNAIVNTAQQVVNTTITFVTVMAIDSLIRNFERLQPGGADETTWTNTGLVGMGA